MGMTATVAYENEESKAFPVNNGVKKGCVLAPVLFNISFSYLIRHAFNSEKISEIGHGVTILWLLKVGNLGVLRHTGLRS